MPIRWMQARWMQAGALALGGAIATAGPGATQSYDPSIYIRDIVPTVLDMEASDASISAEAEDMLGRSGNIDVRQEGDSYILSVASDILFAFDSDDLSAEAQDSLRDVATVILNAPEGQVTVAGHTDSKGTEAYNLDLSQRRADVVAAFLQDEGVPSDRIRTEGRGQAEPVAENEIDGQDNPDGRAQNRRVEFVVPSAMLQD